MATIPRHQRAVPNSAAPGARSAEGLVLCRWLEAVVVREDARAYRAPANIEKSRL